MFKNKMKRCLFALCLLSMITDVGVASAQLTVTAPLAVAPCVGVVTVTYPSATEAQVDGTSCRDTFDLDPLITAMPGITKVKVSLKGQNDTFTSSYHTGVTLVVNGGSGDDIIKVGGTVANVFTKVELFGDDGNDSIAGYENPGRIVGGAGADLIESGDATRAVTVTLSQDIYSAPTTTPAPYGDASADVIKCYAGPLRGLIFDDPAEGDSKVGC